MIDNCYAKLITLNGTKLVVTLRKQTYLKNQATKIEKNYPLPMIPLRISQLEFFAFKVLFGL